MIRSALPLPTLLLLAACTGGDAGAPKPGGDTAADTAGDDTAADTAGDDTAADTGEDTGSDCDPTVASLQVPDMHADVGIVQAEIVPSAIDPETDRFPQSHHTLMVPTGIERRDELFLMLPGTGNHGTAFDAVATVAAHAGYAVLVLAYDSELNHAGICAEVPLDEMEACRTAVIHEKIYGTDETDLIDVDEADSIVGRAVRVLNAADAEYPDAGAGRYLDGDTLAWDQIVVAGFSQGSVMAGYLSKDHAFARAVLLAGGCDAMDAEDGSIYLAEWCTAERATPADRTYAISHVQDEPEKDAAIHAAYGLDAFGDYADIATEAPAYCTDTHLLASTVESSGADTDRYHLSVAHDDYIPVDDEGVPVLAEDYWYAFAGP